MNNLVKIVIYQQEVKKDFAGRRTKKVNVRCRLENGEIVTKEEWRKRVNQTAHDLKEEHILETLINLTREIYRFKNEDEIIESAMDSYSFRIFEDREWVLFERFNEILGDTQISLF